MIDENTQKKIDLLNSQIKELADSATKAHADIAGPVKSGEIQDAIVDDYKKLADEKEKNFNTMKSQANKINELEEIISKSQLIQDTISNSNKTLQEKVQPETKSEQYVYDRNITEINAVKHRMETLQGEIDSGSFKPKNIFQSALSGIKR